ncbi:MAG TPA: zf-HC2 domain-containing protein [Bryobacteraceae bacterium]|nr:zf-HC2 domain-containing protein [Bryobacteraceae bacterium]
MEHHRAAETQAVERYLLGQMPQDERNEFEEHFFICPDCARDVREGARFRANARELLRDPEQFAHAREPRRLLSWSFPSLVPVAASVLLMGVVAYQAGFEIPSLRRQIAARPIAQGAISVRLRDITRGVGDVAQIQKGSGLVSLRFDIISDKKEASYQCTIADAGGRVMASPIVEAPMADEPALIELQREDFPPGPYTVSVRGASNGGAGEILAQYKFEIH